jgi:hypothetical protein
MSENSKITDQPKKKLDKDYNNTSDCLNPNLNEVHENFYIYSIHKCLLLILISSMNKIAQSTVVYK